MMIERLARSGRKKVSIYGSMITSAEEVEVVDPRLSMVVMY